MHYFDTSAIASLFLNEPTTEKVGRFLLGLSDGELAVSCWTCVEFSSVLAREVRMGGFTASEALRMDAFFSQMMAEFFMTFPVILEAFKKARVYLRSYDTGLRAGDALHLAVAANRNARAIYTFDKTMLKAGVHLGLPVYEIG